MVWGGSHSEEVRCQGLEGHLGSWSSGEGSGLEAELGVSFRGDGCCGH